MIEAWHRMASTIHDAFVTDSCGAYEMRALVIGWCVLVAGLAAHTAYKRIKAGRRG